MLVSLINIIYIPFFVYRTVYLTLIGELTLIDLSKFKGTSTMLIFSCMGRQKETPRYSCNLTDSDLLSILLSVGEGTKTKAHCGSF